MKQKFMGDCGLVCLSLLLKQDYEYIRTKYFPSHDFSRSGLSIDELSAVIDDFGISYIHDSLDVKDKGILFVRSLNYPNQHHFVYYEPGLLIDPSNKLCYSISDFPTVYWHLTIVNSKNYDRIISHHEQILSKVSKFKQL